VNFFDSYYETAQVISTVEARNEFYGAVIEYYYTGELPEFESNEARVAFMASRVNIDNSRKRANAGKAGAENRWHSDEDGKPDSKPDGKPMANTRQADSKPDGEAIANQNQTACDGDSDIDMEKDMELERDIPPIAPHDQIIAYLNEKTGKSFRANSRETKRLISGRLSEGYTVSDFFRVIDVKAEAWNHPPKPGKEDMRPYLRPQTLFRPGNFESYVNEIGGGSSVDLGSYAVPQGSPF